MWVARAIRRRSRASPRSSRRVRHPPRALIRGRCAGRCRPYTRCLAGAAAALDDGALPAKAIAKPVAEACRSEGEANVEAQFPSVGKVERSEIMDGKGMLDTAADAVLRARAAPRAADAVGK